MKKKDEMITTIIGRGAECGGDFSAEGSVRLDGIVNGGMSVTGKLIVGATGAVYGDITAAVAVIGGEVNGNVTAPDRVELTSTARVIGDITTSTIVIDEKAVFQGGCNMNQEASAKRARPGMKAVRSGKKSAKAAITEALKEVAAENRREAAAEENAPDIEDSRELRG